MNPGARFRQLETLSESAAEWSSLNETAMRAKEVCAELLQVIGKTHAEVQLEPIHWSKLKQKIADVRNRYKGFQPERYFKLLQRFLEIEAGS